MWARRISIRRVSAIDALSCVCHVLVTGLAHAHIVLCRDMLWTGICLRGMSHQHVIYIHTEVRLAMTENTSIWEERPLKESYIQYAAQDVCFLYEAFHKMVSGMRLLDCLLMFASCAWMDAHVIILRCIISTCVISHVVCHLLVHSGVSTPSCLVAPLRDGWLSTLRRTIP